MYVPKVLSEGKMLYRDVWSPYGPLAPYFNSFLFRVFGTQLNVLYWAGSLSALGSAIFLYLTGMRLSSWLAGFSAGTVLLLEAFHPTVFCFPLPYSFSAAYGCLTACIFLWLVVTASARSGWGWMFGAGLAAATALLLKLEFGTASYVTLALLILARGLQQRSWKSILRDSISILPGMLICAMVIRWMVSIAGVDFILQENFMSWPTSYFLKTYGKFWLAQSGLSLSLPAFVEAAKQALVFLGFWQGVHLLLTWKRPRQGSILLRVLLFFAALTYLVIYVPGRDVYHVLLFPKEMVLYVTLAGVAALFYFWREQEIAHASGLILLLIFSGLLAFRIVLRMVPWDYAIYVNGPVVLSFLLLLRPFTLEFRNSRRPIFVTEMLVCLGCLAVPALYARRVMSETASWVPLTTERGTIVVKKSLAEQYRAAIQFMKEKNAQGEAVLSVPEDTSLYFLSGAYCPARVFLFNPGIVVPGKMTAEVIDQLEHHNVKYLIWSNRIYPEYGALRFGIDFDQTLGKHLMTHYHRVQPLLPEPVALGDWNAYVWERNGETQ
jgi:hypothetical protein